MQDSLEPAVLAALADEQRLVLVFPLARCDEKMAAAIGSALERSYDRFFRHRREHVFLMSGWLPIPTHNEFERIRRFGDCLRERRDIGLWLICGEKNAEDIRRYAAGELYVTGRLLSAGIPVFDPDMSEGDVSTAVARMTPDTLAKWCDQLRTMAPGPLDLSQWRHGIRGRILATVNLDLQLSDSELDAALCAKETSPTLAKWAELVDARPYSEQQPAVTRAASALLRAVEAFRVAPEGGRGAARSALSVKAEELRKALDGARDDSTNVETRGAHSR